MKYRSFLRLGLALGLIGCLLVACSQDPNVRKQKYFQAGQLYFERNKYSEAAAEFLNAVKIDPRYAEANYQLAQSCLKLQQWQCAHQALARTVELQPDKYQAHID